MSDFIFIEEQLAQLLPVSLSRIGYLHMRASIAHDYDISNFLTE
jgi:hypothetical protein